jgi:C-terminal peptidase prc
MTAESREISRKPGQAAPFSKAYLLAFLLCIAFGSPASAQMADHFFSQSSKTSFTWLPESTEFQSGDKVEEIDKKWESVKLKDEFLKSSIAQKTCYQDIRFLFACLYALNSLYFKTDLNLRIFSKEDELKERIPCAIGRCTFGPSIIGYAEKDIRKHPVSPITWPQVIKLHQLHYDHGRSIPFEELYLQVEEHLENEKYSNARKVFAYENFQRITTDNYFDLAAPGEALRYEEYETTEEGFGIELSREGPPFTVERVFPTSAADEMGLKVGDRVQGFRGIGEHSDNHFYNELKNENIEPLLSGELGERIQLSISREGFSLQKERSEAFEVSLQRGSYAVSSIQADIFREIHDKTIAYLRIESFLDECPINDNDGPICVSFEKALRDRLSNFQESGVDHLILDLRGNTGGFMSQASEVADLLLPKDLPLHKRLPVSERNASRAKIDELPHFSSNLEPIYTGPMVVLIDGESASASEYLAGVLKEHNRAWILGERSYGKGVYAKIQNTPAYSFKEQVKIKEVSVHGYVLVGGEWSAQEIGIMPDFLIDGAKRPPVKKKPWKYYEALEFSYETSNERLRQKSEIQKCLQEGNLDLDHKFGPSVESGFKTRLLKDPVLSNAFLMLVCF